MWCWMVTNILELLLFGSFQENNSKSFRILSVNYYIKVYKQVLIRMIDIVSSYTTFPAKIDFWVSKNKFPQILVISDPMSFVAGLHISKWKILIGVKTISQSNCFKGV